MTPRAPRTAYAIVLPKLLTALRAYFVLSNWVVAFRFNDGEAGAITYHLDKKEVAI